MVEVLGFVCRKFSDAKKRLARGSAVPRKEYEDLALKHRRKIDLFHKLRYVSLIAAAVTS